MTYNICYQNVCFMYVMQIMQLNSLKEYRLFSSERLSANIICDWLSGFVFSDKGKIH